MKQGYILILMILLNHIAEGKTGKISGKVINSEDGTALPGVTVYIPDILKGTATNVQGTFEINDLPYGTYLIKFSSIGFATVVKKVNLNEEDVHLEIGLSQETFLADEVVISGGSITLKDESPLKIESMDIDLIRRSGSPTLMTAITQIPGVEQISFGTGIGKPVIRGLSFSRILTVYQGTRFENQQWGEDHGLGLNDLGAEKVEVIKGPASLIYGSGALAGVINIIDEKPATKDSKEGDLQISAFSNTLGMRANAGLKGNSNDFNWGIRYGHENHADFMDGNNRLTGNSRFQINTLKAFGGMQKKRFNTRLTYTFSHQLLGIIAEGEMAESLATTRNDRTLQLPFQDIHDHLISSQSTILLNKGKLKINLAYHLNKRKEIENAFDETDLGLRLHTATYDLKYIRPVGNNGELITGVQGFRQSNINLAESLKTLLPDAHLQDNSLYFLYTQSLSKLTFLVGTRFDHRVTTANSHNLPGFTLPGDPDNRSLSLSFSGFSGSVGATYNFSKNFLLRTNIASGFRAPDLAELFSNGEHPGTNRFEKGNVRFEREQNIEGDLGALYKNRNFSAEASIFYNHLNNYIYFSPTGEEMNGMMIWEFMQSDAKLYGGEAGIEFHPRSLKWLNFKTTYARVTGIRRDNNSHLPLIPPGRFDHALQFSLNNLGKLHQPYLSLRLKNVITQNNIAEDELITPAYNLVGIATGTTLNIGKERLELNLVINNLLNVVYFDHLAIMRPFGIHQPGRNISINVNMPFRF